MLPCAQVYLPASSRRSRATTTFRVGGHPILEGDSYALLSERVALLKRGITVLLG